MSIPPEICPHAMCSLLPFGFVLLTSDCYHDLRWCLLPSDTTKEELKEYYMKILTPRLYPPCPGFFFPMYVTYIFCGICPDWICWALFVLYIPLCKRYWSIAHGRDDLDSWWYIVCIRMIMGILTYIAIQRRGCQMNDYRDDFNIYWNSVNESLTTFFRMDEL